MGRKAVNISDGKSGWGKEIQVGSLMNEFERNNSNVVLWEGREGADRVWVCDKVKQLR